jgi:hypothetical protein
MKQLFPFESVPTSIGVTSNFAVGLNFYIEETLYQNIDSGILSSVLDSAEELVSPNSEGHGR